MSEFIQKIKIFIRKLIAKVALYLDKTFGKKVTPNMVTYTGLIMHIPIALLIGTGNLLLAAVFLIIFGLFDTLDGELARLQKVDSVSGMFLDAATDRFKEVLIYMGIIYYLGTNHYSSIYLMFTILALGASMSVSFVKAKGEAAVASNKHNEIKHQELNRMFSSGILSFEVRMVLLIIGLMFGLLIPVIILIAIFSTYTAFVRLMIIMEKLKQ